MLSVLQCTLLAETTGIRKGLQPLHWKTRDRTPRNLRTLKDMFIYIIN